MPAHALYSLRCGGTSTQDCFSSSGAPSTKDSGQHNIDCFRSNIACLHIATRIDLIQIAVETMPSSQHLGRAVSSANAAPVTTVSVSAEE